MESGTRSITILGSTGSIGTQTLKVMAGAKNRYSLRWLTANTNAEELALQAKEWRPYGIAIRDKAAWERFRRISDFSGPILCGEDGLCEAAADSENDFVMSAMVGFSGVLPTVAAIRAGHLVGLANKETLVSAGQIITEAVTQSGARLIAVDSEHSAVLQCLRGEDMRSVRRIILTASGGPFRGFSPEQLKEVTVDQALKHPNWTMGNKITIDSATLMNKGFEVIEARWLFDVPADKIDVLIHPESIVHSLVEFNDRSVKAQLGIPSMLVPIQYALNYPERNELDIEAPDLAKMGCLTFEKPDLESFPCLALAYQALNSGTGATCVLNAANEIAVAAFLEGVLPLPKIADIIAECLDTYDASHLDSLDDVIATDAGARQIAASLVSSLVV